MTYQSALNELYKLALAGSSDLIPATSALPGISGWQVYRAIQKGLIPAVKVGGWKTTEAIAREFFGRLILPQEKKTPAVLSPNRKAEIEAARLVVFGKESKNAGVKTKAARIADPRERCQDQSDRDPEKRGQAGHRGSKGSANCKG